MSKKLAIRGHSTRGKEVIELLEMMGGKNIHNRDGEANAYSYYLYDNAILSDRLSVVEDDDFEIFTLQDFLEKFPYKVGDKVHIYVQNDDIDERCDIDATEITSMRWNPTIRKIAYKMKNINREFYKEEIKCKVDDSNKPTKDMGKRLAIRGHSTRGKEVIEILEMMGGINKNILSAHIGDVLNPHVYFLEPDSSDNRIVWNYLLGLEWDGRASDMMIFTLEEFLEKYPFNVGDKVVYTKFGDNCDDYPVTIESMKWTGTTIEYTFNDCVTCLAKDLKMWTGELDVVISGIYLNSYDYADEVELYLGDYEIEVRDGKTYAVKKKPKYPKLANLTECKEILGEKDIYQSVSGYKGELLTNFQRLLIFRDAYWKIAGDELGLDEPWKPKFGKIILYDISFYLYQDNLVLHKGEYPNSDICILVFPTEEMRDTFYDNFKDLIEQCKELL